MPKMWYARDYPLSPITTSPSSFQYIRTLKVWLGTKQLANNYIFQFPILIGVALC